MEAAAGTPQLRLMLQSLLADRFKLQVHTDIRERQIYVLVAAQNRPKLRSSCDGSRPGYWRFHGDLPRFAGVLALELTTPLPDDPATPSHAAGTAIPVIDETKKTETEGIWDICLDIQPEHGADPFTIWQRALHEQPGLKLESRRSPVELLVVDHADRILARN